ncbi:MAG: hypothetical protein JO322_05755 [Candidatus Eremiobacteraeota bacterium]|nr:hypothetical protein [Candidatus Eremiobacteraeota bacterium]
MKRLVISAVCGLALAASVTAAALAAPPNITGNWKVEQSGVNGQSVSSVKLHQSGNTITGTSSNGNNFQGQFVNDSQINATWHGPGGAGWLTVYATPNGHSLNGTWGYNGRKSNGSFVANKFLPPSPITAAGAWNVTGAGGPAAFVGLMKCTQSGKAVVCNAGSVVLNGAFKAPDKVRAKWTGNGQTGWFSFWFNGDNNSFNGVWGKGAETTPPIGRVVGQRSMSNH